MSCLGLTLRQAESFCEDLSPKQRRRLGLTRRFSDSALYEMLPRLEQIEMRPVLWHQLRADLESKAIVNDLFPGGVATWDGKGAGSGMGEAPNALCRSSVCDDKGTACWDAFALRVCLTSSQARPVLDQEFISRKRAEPSVFPEIYRRVDAQFRKLFRYNTWDAGLTSASNAQLVISSGKHYVAAIKENFNKLFPLARELLKSCPVLAFTDERASGKQVRRELRRTTVPASVVFPGATEFWSVRQTSIDKSGAHSVDERVFVVSIPTHELTDERRLQLVRLHWGIENGPNWAADVILAEDTHTACTQGNAVLVLGWLRALAYNMLSVFRSHLPLKDRRPQSWGRSAQILRDTLLEHRLEMPEVFAMLG